ncbi:MAG: hypothetical protein JWO30_1839 [Fibrobacteres bacterium]|nr:hypothetical protein [Fibrobacterota bacterium]
MLPLKTLDTYRNFIEYRLLSVLEKRSIEYESDVTRTITGAISDLGKHLDYHVTLERKYYPLPQESLLHRCDVHWRGDIDHIWEIDSTLKQKSVNKLAGAKEPEKIWILWARETELPSLRLMDLHGINVLIPGADVRKLVWDRLAMESAERRDLQSMLEQKLRFERAAKLDENIRG